ncbi:unnamed protein product [Notodromas monacha]|uniref:Coiled-coil domain-containing protein 25 n=1 Tax=Notodromas monacha TaxID=399045 RepID=A0A7R9BTB3_9CRUS|nr:unnamed protein product [Notodromas monacha]CAG0919739.1 unnamed protein product [Notodromas monacha]
MVFYFTTNVVSPPVTLFMGLDKYENEDLIKWGWPEHVWFHVDKLSSAHVYLELKPNETLEDIPEAVIQDACQLVKANSIQGNKTNDLDIVYTMWSNLKKTKSMEVGQVAFRSEKAVKKVRVAKRINEIVNRLNKTKVERKVDLQALREERDRKEREERKEGLRKQKEQEKEMEKEKMQQAELRSYSTLMKSENMTTNRDDGNDSDEFM